MYADLVLFNGKIATVDDRFTIVEAVAVKDGRITDADTDEKVKTKIGPETKVIDLEGKVALPGACDAHMHAGSTGLVLRPETLDFKAVRSLGEMREMLEDAVKAIDPGDWIFGSGIQEYTVPELTDESRGLTRYDLDTVTPENPVAVMDADHHTLIVNSRALDIAGFDVDSRELLPEEGLIGRGADGGLNGRFEEYGAINMMARHIPVLTDSELEDCIMRMQNLLNSQGITSHTDILGAGGKYIMRGSWSDRMIHAYEKLRREGKLTARVCVNYFAAEDGIHTYDSIMRGLGNTEQFEFGDEKWVQIQGVKLFGDKMTIWDEEGIGRSMFPGSTEPEQITEIERTVSALHKMGYQILTHAIGGKMVDVIVDAYVKAQEEHPREDPRHIIIHGDGIGEDNMHDMKKHGIGVSCQPISFPVLAMLHIDAMGDEAFNWQLLSDRGIVVAGGSDYSSTGWTEICKCPVSWLEGLQHAVVRDTVSGDVMRGELGMTLVDGIRMYTINAAWQDRSDSWRGSLEPGKVADIQVLGEDIFCVPKEKIGDIPVVMTIIDGKIVYEGTK